MSQALLAASNLRVWFICTLCWIVKYLKIYILKDAYNILVNLYAYSLHVIVWMLEAEFPMLDVVVLRFGRWLPLAEWKAVVSLKYCFSHSFRVKDFWPVCQISSAMTRLLGHVLGTQASVQENISLGHYYYHYYHSQSHRKLEGLHIYCIQLLQSAKLIKLWNPTLSL